MKYLFITILLGVIIFPTILKAQEIKVEYKEGIVVDSDLDGLTDEGEKQIYGTDPRKADSDADGYLDGAEILSGTDPGEESSYPGKLDISEINSLMEKETPWAWYVSRASGLIAFVFLWLTIFLGLAIRNPLLKRIIEPIYSFDFHAFTAVVAVFWALIHGTSLLFDKFIGFGAKDVAIPYFSQVTFVNTNYLALGIMAFYAMVIMTITSYLRSHMNFWVWRVLHFMNPVAFIFVVIHGYSIGTDMENDYVANTYLYSSTLLVLLYLSSLIFMIISKIRNKMAQGRQE